MNATGSGGKNGVEDLLAKAKANLQERAAKMNLEIPDNFQLPGAPVNKDESRENLYETYDNEFGDMKAKLIAQGNPLAHFIDQ